MGMLQCMDQKMKQSLENEQLISDPVPAYFNIQGIKIRYIASGAGEQVLLLHGWGGSINTIRPIFDELSKYYAVFAVDFPGHGESGLPPDSWGVADFSIYLLQVMDKLKLQKPHIIAHSFGGRVTIYIAAMQPERVSKLILVNSAGIRPSHSLRYYFRMSLATIGRKAAEYGGTLGKQVRDKIYSRIEYPDYVNAGPLREVFVNIVNEDLTKFLSHIKSPTLLIWGANDMETPLSSARIIERLIPGSKLIVFENASHYSYLDQSNKFHLLVRRFLRE